MPQLRITLVYDIPHDIQVKKQYKVDSFPEENHNPLSDHDDFANVMSQRHHEPGRQLHQPQQDLPGVS